MRLGLVTLTACGRIGFDESVTPGDGAGDGPEQIEVFADFSAEFTYRSPDFDDNGELLDNVPRTLCALDPVFGAPFAAIAGRSLIELAPPAAAVIHDYTPAMANDTGPDELRYCLTANVGGLGPALWLAAGSLAAGDGLYLLTPDWLLTRDNADNNVGGLVIDQAGAFTGGSPDLLFVSDGEWRERPGNTVIQTLSMRVSEMAPTSSGDPVGFVFDDTFSIFTLTAFSAATLDPTPIVPFAVEPRLAVDSVAPTPYLAYGLVNQHDLVGFLPSGMFDILASAPDFDTQWWSVSIPKSPHPLAGGVYVLESNFTLGRFRVMRIPIQ